MTTIRSPALELGGVDEPEAAVRLERFFGEQGLLAERSPRSSSVFVYRNARTTLLSPAMETGAIDRLIASRNYAPAPGKGVEDLRDLAVSLNDRLNVGVFAVDEGTLLFQSSLTFLDSLALDELIAFLDWLDQAEQAIRVVDGERRVLHITSL